MKLPYSDAALAEMRGADAAASRAPAAAPTEPPRAEPATPAGSGAKAAPESNDTGAWGWPATGRVLQNFDESSNKGISLAGRIGDPVVAAADGRVIFSGTGPRGYGNLVIVKHGGDLLSVYAHNKSLTVKEGQSVNRGQKIAELGESGTNSPKLHFEIRQQGKPVDPLKFLPRR
jgi:lipoprotein NlpD